MNLILGTLAGLLATSIACNAALYFTRRRADVSTTVRLRSADDRAHAAELRAAKQIDAMLDRIHTEPRIEMRAAVPNTPPLDAKPYISEYEHDDARWNDLTAAAGENH
jgi:hypothetical protein